MEPLKEHTLHQPHTLLYYRAMMPLANVNLLVPGITFFFLFQTIVKKLEKVINRLMLIGFVSGLDSCFLIVLIRLGLA